MEGFRSKSCKNPESFFSYSYGYSSCGGPPPHMQQPSSMQDLRCYSANHAYAQQQQQQPETSSKAAENGGGAGPAVASSSSSSSSRSWSLTDRELQRKKRVASYKVYAVEGKVKGSIKKSFRWIRTTCSNVVYGSRR